LPAELIATETSIPWRQIVGFRDVLAHGYFAIESSVVWDAAYTKAPTLKFACEIALPMSDAIITVENLGKRYRLGAVRSA